MGLTHHHLHLLNQAFKWALLATTLLWVIRLAVEIPQRHTRDKKLWELRFAGCLTVAESWSARPHGLRSLSGAVVSDPAAHQTPLGALSTGHGTLEQRGARNTDLT